MPVSPKGTSGGAPSRGHEPIREGNGGVLLSVHVVPRARRDTVDGMYGDAIRIRLAAPPVEGRANAALLRFLCRKLGVSRAAADLRTGRASRHKLVWIEGVTRAAAERALQPQDDPGR
jgi:uncharacterized protein (TIGR00251 family)